MGLNNFILNCEKENKEMIKDIEYYKNKSERLQQRIDKAIEYVKNIQRVDNYLDGIPCDDILSILQGKEMK